jgi:hypothetical protein
MKIKKNVINNIILKLNKLNDIKLTLNNPNLNKIKLNKLNNELNELNNEFNLLKKNKTNKKTNKKMIHLYPVNNKLKFKGKKFGNGKINQYYVIGNENKENKENFKKYEEAINRSYIVHVDIASSTKKTLIMKKKFTDLQPLIQAILQTYEPKKGVLKPLFVHFAGDAYGFIFFDEDQVMNWAINSLLVLYIIIPLIMTVNSANTNQVVSFGNQLVPPLKLNLASYKSPSTETDPIEKIRPNAPRTKKTQSAIMQEHKLNVQLKTSQEGVEIRIGIYKHGDIYSNNCISNSTQLLEYQEVNKYKDYGTMQIVRINQDVLCNSIKLEERAINNGINTNFDNEKYLNNNKQYLNNNIKLEKNNKVKHIYNEDLENNDYENIIISKENIDAYRNTAVNSNITYLLATDKSKLANNQIILLKDIFDNVDKNFVNLYKSVLFEKYLNPEYKPVLKRQPPRKKVPNIPNIPNISDNSLSYYSGDCVDFHTINNDNYYVVMYGTIHSDDKLTLTKVNKSLNDINGFVVKVFGGDKSFYALFKGIGDSIKFAENFTSKYKKSNLGIYHLEKKKDHLEKKEDNLEKYEDYFHNIRENYYKNAKNLNEPKCILDIIGPPFNYAERVKSWGLPNGKYGYALYSKENDALYSKNGLTKFENFQEAHQGNEIFKKWTDSGLKSEFLYNKTII